MTLATGPQPTASYRMPRHRGSLPAGTAQPDQFPPESEWQKPKSGAEGTGQRRVECGVGSGAETKLASRGDQVNKAFICSDQTTRSVLSEMRDLMAAQGLDDEALGTLELILAEALNNVTEHAYGPEGGPVELSIRLSGPGQGARTASAQPTNHTPAKPQAGAATDPLANAATASDISPWGRQLGGRRPGAQRVPRLCHCHRAGRRGTRHPVRIARFRSPHARRRPPRSRTAPHRPA